MAVFTLNIPLFTLNIPLFTLNIPLFTLNIPLRLCILRGSGQLTINTNIYCVSRGQRDYVFRLVGPG
jgi:hypothetical protein